MVDVTAKASTLRRAVAREMVLTGYSADNQGRRQERRFRRTGADALKTGSAATGGRHVTAHLQDKEGVSRSARR